MLPLLQQPQQGHDRRHGQGDQSGQVSLGGRGGQSVQDDKDGPLR